MYSPTGGKTYTLASSIGSTDNTILLTSFKEPVSDTPYTMAMINSDICYATIAPKTTSTEFISFTGITQNGDGTATLTGVTRGLSRSSPFTSSATFKLPHSGQTQLILSNSPQQINEYVTLRNNETISGVKTFSSFPITPSSAPTTDYQAANKKYVDDTATFGAPMASTTVAGIVEEATQAETDARTQTGGTGAELFINPTTLRSTKVSDYVATDTGIADAYAIAPSPAITAYVAGQTFVFKATNANTGASTLNVNSLGTVQIVKEYNAALSANDIKAGQVIMVTSDGTVMQLMSPVGNAPMPLSYLDTTTTLGTSNTKVPTQNATKTYVDTQVATKPWTLDSTTTFTNDATKTITLATSYDKIMLIIELISDNATTPNTNAIYMRLNGDTGNNYAQVNTTNAAVTNSSANSAFIFISGAVRQFMGQYFLDGRTTTTIQGERMVGEGLTSTIADAIPIKCFRTKNANENVSTITFLNPGDGSPHLNGTVKIYGLTY